MLGQEAEVLQSIGRTQVARSISKSFTGSNCACPQTETRDPTLWILGRCISHAALRPQLLQVSVLHLPVSCDVTKDWHPVPQSPIGESQQTSRLSSYWTGFRCGSASLNRGRDQLLWPAICCPKLVEAGVNAWNANVTLPSLP